MKGAKASEKKVSDIVYDTLLAKLLEKELIPGDMLNRREVARELGVSVAPVLEAMLRLENEGFLEGIPRKGTQVKLVRQPDILGQLIVREALECGAARLYCGQPILDNWETLEPVANKLDNCHVHSLPRWELEIAFHRSLVLLTECKPLVQIFDRTIRLTAYFRINNLIGATRIDVKDRHLKLLTVLKNPDPDKAEKAIRNHVRSGKEIMFADMIKQYG